MLHQPVSSSRNTPVPSSLWPCCPDLCLKYPSPVLCWSRFFWVSHQNGITHTHNHFTALFPGLPGWAGAVRNLLDFMVQREMSEADTLTIQLGIIPSGLISDSPPSSPIFLCQMPFLRQPSQFVLAWDRHQIYWLAYQVACINSNKNEAHF